MAKRKLHAHRNMVHSTTDIERQSARVAVARSISHSVIERLCAQAANTNLIITVFLSYFQRVTSIVNRWNRVEASHLPAKFADTTINCLQRTQKR